MVLFHLGYIELFPKCLPQTVASRKLFFKSVTCLSASTIKFEYFITGFLEIGKKAHSFRLSRGTRELKSRLLRLGL